MTECTHRMARSLSLARCPLHSNEAARISVWSWSLGTTGQPHCPCVAGDRFVVAAEPVTEQWQGCVDVMLAGHRGTVRDAMGVAIQGGCALVATPVIGTSIVFRTHGGVILVVPDRSDICGVCLYPWLVISSGPSTLDALQNLPTAVPRPRRESAAR